MKIVTYLVEIHGKLNFQLGHSKELKFCVLSLNEEKSAAMPFESEVLLCQLFMSSNTGSNILI